MRQEGTIVNKIDWLVVAIYFALVILGWLNIYAAVYDEEMESRILHHKEQRMGKGFVTIERNRNIGNAAEELNGTDTVLLDCLGNLLANEMFGGGDPDAIFGDVCRINDTVENLIIISNDVFSDGCRYSESVMRYIDKLAELHKQIVKEADVAIESIFGNYVYHKGRL